MCIRSFLLACILSTSAFLTPVHEGAAQPAPGTCDPGLAGVDLESDFLRARLFNGGNLFYRPGNAEQETEEAEYVVPKESGNSLIYAASFVIGGLVGGELRTAAAQYVSPDFWPGPLDEDGRPPDDCASFDRMYSLTRADVALLSCPAGADSVEWPAQVGAPVLDGDGITGNFDVDAGDRPALLGDRMVWWVMNDAGNDHGEGGTDPIGLEVRGSAFLFDLQHGRFPDSPMAHHLRYSTFYRFEIDYQGSEPLEDAYVGLHVDPDLGDGADDFTGTDTTLHFAYAYNSRPSDGLYGEPPPAVGAAMLRGPEGRNGERLGLEASAKMWKGFQDEYDDPDVAEEYYNLMRGLFTRGDSMRMEGMGIGPEGEPTVFHYPGDPVAGTFWSEVNVDGEGTANNPGDRRFMVTSGPFDMEPGETETVELAIVTAFGSDHLDSVTELRLAVAEIRRAHEAIFSPTVAEAPGSCPEPPEPPTYPFEYVRNFPDPVQTSTTFSYSLPAPAHVRLRVFDALGRERAVVVDARQDAGPQTVSFEVNGLAAGVYYSRFEVLELEGSRPVVTSDPFVVLP